MIITWIIWLLFAMAYLIVVSKIKETLFNIGKNISEERGEPLSKSDKLFMRTIAVLWPIGVPAAMLWSAIVSFFED